MTMNSRNADVLARLIGSAPSGLRAIPSVCTAHPEVLRITLEHGKKHDMPVLIEATCNQVNQEGGYTGLDPQGFRDLVAGLAVDCGFDAGSLILGGDHLGPNPWKHLPAADAMEKAEAMVAAYVAAGFRKLHLDTSMGCEGEPTALSDEVVAERAARLARVAEATANSLALARPVYIIGTEVPPPGGATESLAHLTVTRPDAVIETVETHRRAFTKAGVEGALERVIGVVVQPGVEFGDDSVALYEPEKAKALSAALSHLPGIAFEAHSTDYQPASLLGQLAEDGFAILKVGPGLTFAWREAIYALDAINAVLSGEALRLMPAMERLMLANPRYWAPYYAGSDNDCRIKRHFSYSDRIRYYWPQPEAEGAVTALLQDLGEQPLPPTLVSQFLGARLGGGAPAGLTARALLDAHVGAVLDDYRAASLR